MLALPLWLTGHRFFLYGGGVRRLVYMTIVRVTIVQAENILVCRDGTLKLVDFGTALDLENPNIKGSGNRSPGPRGLAGLYLERIAS